MAQKIFFYEGDGVLNELDIKRIFKNTNIELQSRYIFCILFDDPPDINEKEKIKLQIYYFYDYSKVFQDLLINI